MNRAIAFQESIPTCSKALYTYFSIHCISLTDKELRKRGGILDEVLIFNILISLFNNLKFIYKIKSVILLTQSHLHAV